MAFVLTPSFAPAYQTPHYNPFGFCASVSQSPYGCRVTRSQPRRPQYSPYSNFFSQVNDLLSEIDREAQRQVQLEAHREAQREAHRQRHQQRKRALRAKFNVNPSEQGWSVEGDIQGFGRENISIEVTDEHTLKISGNTQWQLEKAQSESTLPQIGEKAESASAPAIEQSTEQASEAAHDPEVETTTDAESTTAGIATPDSDTLSHKSYQATVEDDFEDLGAESSSSTPSTPAEATEPKGKEKAVEESVNTETALATQPQPEVPALPQQEPEQQERVHGSFTRSFRFPSRIDIANVSASFRDGVLRVNVPRAQVPQLRRIAIL